MNQHAPLAGCVATDQPTSPGFSSYGGRRRWGLASTRLPGYCKSKASGPVNRLGNWPNSSWQMFVGGWANCGSWRTTSCRWWRNAVKCRRESIAPRWIGWSTQEATAPQSDPEVEHLSLLRPVWRTSTASQHIPKKRLFRAARRAVSLMTLVDQREAVTEQGNDFGPGTARYGQSTASFWSIWCEAADHGVTAGA